MLSKIKRFAMPIFMLMGLATLVFAFLRVQASQGAKSLSDQLKTIFSSGGGTIIFILGCAAVISTFFFESSPLILAVVWGTVGASTTGTFTFNYVPQFIEFVTTTAPTTIQINVNGDGLIFNLDGANGIPAMGGIRQYGRIVTGNYVFQLANGLINGKNGSVTITTGVSACTVRTWSPIGNGSFYFVYMQASALANQSYNLQNFAYAAFPSAAAADQIQIAYPGGSLDNITREELAAYLNYFQNSATTANGYSIDNIAPSRIKQLTFTPAAAQTFYVMKYQAASGIVNPNPLQS